MDLRPLVRLLLLSQISLYVLSIPVSALAVPGLVDGTGDDTTLDLVYALETFAAVDPNVLTTQLWFDPYRGDDVTGDGSPQAPYRSVAMMKAVCVSHVRCTVAGVDRVFSPLTLRMTGVEPGEDFERGETLFWDGGASSGTVLDWSADDAILVIDWDSGSRPVAGERNLVGSTSGADGHVRFIRGILNTVGGHMVHTFPPSAIDLSTGVIRIIGHAYIDGEGPMRFFSNGVVPDGLAKNVDYTICTVSSNTFRLDDDADCSSPITSYAYRGSGLHGIAGVSNAWADDPIQPQCDDRDRLCVLIESEDPARPARIDGNGFHVTGYDNRTAPGVFGANPDNAVAYANGDGDGWVGWQNLPIQNIAADAFSTQSANHAKLIVLNSPARDIRNGTENRTSTIGTNNCYTTHGGGVLVALNGGGSESRVDSSAGSGGCLAPTGNAKFTLIGTGTMRSERVGAFPTSTVAATGNDIVVIGHELLGATTGNHVFAFTSANGPVRVQLARTVLRASPWNGGAAFAALGGLHGATVRIFESTLHGANDQYGEAIFLGDISANGLDFDARGLLIDDYPIWLETQNLTTSLTNVGPLRLEGYYDDEDTAGGDAAEFFFGASQPAPTTVAEARADVTALGAHKWSLYQRLSRDSNGASPGTAWLDDVEQLRCQPSEACWGAYRDRYTVDLRTIHGDDPDLSCLPADVLGEPVCAFRLRGRHIGARGAPDADGDLMADTTEAALGTDPADPDSDGDGLEDGFEHIHGFDPHVPGEATLDPDADGLDNLGEQTHGTDPHVADTDDDGTVDGAEILFGSDPLDVRSRPETVMSVPGPGAVGMAVMAMVMGLAGIRRLRRRADRAD